MYSIVGFECKAENATTGVNVGNIAFWSGGTSLVIFFGRTPVSGSEKPVPYSLCNIVGKLLNFPSYGEKLLKVKAGEKIVVRKSLSI